MPGFVKRLKSDPAASFFRWAAFYGCRNARKSGLQRFLPECPIGVVDFDDLTLIEALKDQRVSVRENAAIALFCIRHIYRALR
jgi:hypothetical protein